MYSKTEEQEKQYIQYIDEHIKNVRRAYGEYGLIIERTLGLRRDEENALAANVHNHDRSKLNEIEFIGYRQYFFPAPGEEKDEEAFNKAWLYHIHHNPHHPEYWILVQDADASKNILLDMPRIYIAEMIFDWIAMSYKFDNKVYDWYEKEKDKKSFSEVTRNLVERCMKELRKYDEMRGKENEEEY